MRQAEYTREEIIAAGHELQSAGRSITGFALRKVTGGGNPERLKLVWDEYVSSQQVQKTAPVAELPIEVAEELALVTKSFSDRISELALKLNDKAVQAANRRVHDVIQSASEQRKQADRELYDASQTVEDLERLLDEVRTEAETKANQVSNLQAANQAQAVELAQMRERITISEQTAQRLSMELEQQKQITQAATASRDEGREIIANQRGQLEVMQTQIADLMRAVERR